MARTPSFAVLVQSGPSPLVAVLGSGLDPMAALPAGTRIAAARSFVGGNAWDDRSGAGTEAARLVASQLRPGWGLDGAPEVRLLVAKVAGSDGLARGTATAEALRWVRTIAADLGAEPEILPPAVARALAARGVVALTLAEVERLRRAA